MDYKLKLKYQILESILLNENTEDVIYKVLDKLKEEKGEKLLYSVLDLIDLDSLKEITHADDGTPLFTTKNKDIRSYGKQITLTSSHLCVKWRCRNDVEYFIKNFVKILNPVAGGFTLMKLRYFQKVMIHAFEGHDIDFKMKYQDPNDWENPILDEVDVNFKGVNRIIAKISRQMGKSTIYVVYVLWKTIFFPEQRIGMIANKSTVAKEMVRRFQKSYAKLPLWMQEGTKVWNKTSVELENGSLIVISGQVEDALTGHTFNILIMDEVAKWNTRIYNIIKDSCFPTVSAFGDNGKIIMVSTPLGENFFKDEWVKALNNVKSGGKIGSSFFPVEGTYRDDPTRNTKSWREARIKESDERSFAQEHEGRFLTASGTLISGDVLARLKSSVPLQNIQHIKDVLPKYNKFISIYEQPIAGEVYVLIEDPNESTKSRKDERSEDPDGIGIQVFCITDIEQGWRQVATVNIPGGEIHYLETDIICYKLAEWYNNANIFIENNLGGKMIANNIDLKFAYDNVYFEKPDVGGYRLTTDRKFMVGSLFKFVLEHNALVLRDEDTINQLKFFKEDMKGSAGVPDDLVLPVLGLFYFLLLSEDEIEDLFEDDNNLKLTSIVNIKEKILSSDNNFQEKNEKHILNMVQVLGDYIDVKIEDFDEYLQCDDATLIC